MDSTVETDGLAEQGGIVLFAGFRDYQQAFSAITRRAQARFEARDWLGLHQDAAERLDLYGRVIGSVVAALGELFGRDLEERSLWAAMKAVYSSKIRDCHDLELAETFFNSVTRRIFATIGVDPAIEFVSSDFDVPSPPGDPVFTAYLVGSRLPEVFGRLLRVAGFSLPFADLDRDAGLVVDAIERERRRRGLSAPVDEIDMVHSPFFRNQRAYLVGRICCGETVIPLTLAIRHEEAGLAVDAALLQADEVSIVFSFTRAAFLVEVTRPRDLAAFLKSIMPLKPLAELYIAIGFAKHGKTELYRDLMRHVGASSDRLETAPGERGMVMLVFTLPSFDVVFKVIRDRFDFPKNTSRQAVIDQYRFVFKHDRAGRLADVQEFEHLTFARDRFAPELLAELAEAAAETVTVDRDIVHVRHLFTERRMTPLNLYLREAGADEAAEAILDYGQAVKDMAATNVFPGDMLLKNFGVTRHGRVVFYDYDELCLVTDCNFRDMPAAADDDEGAGEPWFYVGPHDIFPEEFIRFLGLSGALRETFLEAHGDLLTADYWRGVQRRLRAGEIIDVIPYRAGRRLRGA